MTAQNQQRLGKVLWNIADQLRGDYQSGVAEIQCMYAPEFNSHSESIPIIVK